MRHSSCLLFNPKGCYTDCKGNTELGHSLATCSQLGKQRPAGVDLQRLSAKTSGWGVLLGYVGKEKSL